MLPHATLVVDHFHLVQLANATPSPRFAGGDRHLILAAWNAKEDLLDLLALARTHPDRVQVARRLYRFYTRCAGQS